ncbi:MAG: protein tyrosine phosphatase, partial [Anaerovibrio sp.]|nr:protein tyrosine phosphatase [Anaerovibrio sp.]
AKKTGTVNIAVQAKDKGVVFTVPIKVDSVMTEKEFVESMGVKYFRIPIMDYSAPTRANIDRFVEFYKSLPANAWIHAHCEAGVGRTTISLSMVDMIHNADKLSYDEIMTRQVLMGGQDVRKSAEKATDQYKKANYPKRAEFTRRFYDYAKAHPQLDISWSQWCDQQGYTD